MAGNKSLALREQKAKTKLWKDQASGFDGYALGRSLSAAAVGGVVAEASGMANADAGLGLVALGGALFTNDRRWEDAAIGFLAGPTNQRSREAYRQWKAKKAAAVAGDEG